MAYIPFPSGCPYVIISCPLSLFATTATSKNGATNGTDMLVNISNFPAGTVGRILLDWTNNTASRINGFQLYNQTDGADVTGATISQAIVTPGVYQVASSATFSLAAGLKSYMVKFWGSAAGTVTIGGLALQIEKP